MYRKKDNMLILEESTEKEKSIDLREFFLKENIIKATDELMEAHGLDRNQINDWFAESESYWKETSEDAYETIRENYNSFLRERMADIRKPFQEASINRLWSHLENHEPMVFIASSDIERLISIADKFVVTTLGTGYNRIHGSYVESDDAQVTMADSIVAYASSDLEETLFDWSVMVGRLSEQPYILWVNSEGNALFRVLKDLTEEESWDGSPHEEGTCSLGKFNTEVLTRFYTALNDRGFLYKESRITPRRPIKELMDTDKIHI